MSPYALASRLPSVSYFTRSFSLSAAIRDKYDPRVFREPIVNAKELSRSLDPEDDRNFLFIKTMKSGETPVFYRNHVVDKLVCVCMKDGFKETSRNNVYAALEIIKRRQYKQWIKSSEKDKPKIEMNPFKITSQAIRNCHPLMKLQGVTRGGTTYQVPFPIEEAEAEFRAMKMMRDICRQKAARGETKFKTILATELLAAYQNEGLTITAKQELHKQCEANRAFAHYRQ